MEFKHQAHVVYKTSYHIVWITKYRRKILIPGVTEYLNKVITSFVVDKYPDVEISEQNIQPDHIHMLVEIPPKYSVALIVGGIKSFSSMQMRRNFDYLTRASEMWSVGYFVSTVGINEEIIRKYIQNQEKQDKGQAKLVLV